MFKKINKKGELTTAQLVTIIVLIVSFVIILFLIFRLDLGGTTDEEICRNSVVLRGLTPIPSGPLDCKTQYLCVSGGEDCQGIMASEKIEVDPDNKTQIMKAIAEEMVSCWYLFGEGNISYMGRDYKGYHCAICSSIRFGDDIKATFSYGDLFTYLQNTDKSSYQTYLQYLFGVNVASEFISKSNYLTSNYDQPLPLNEGYSILTGRNEELIGKDKVIPVYFIKTRDIGETPCDEFITKA